MSMKYFAQLMWRGDIEGESHAQFVVLVRLSMKEGGRTVRYVLCRYTMPYLNSEEGWSEIVCIKPKKIARAIRRLWPSGGLQSTEFPKCDERRWRKTANWLADVAIECWSLGDWVAVYRLCPWYLKQEHVGASVEIFSTMQPSFHRAEYAARVSKKRERLLRQLRTLQGRNGAGHVVISGENMPKYFAICREIAELNDSNNLAVRKKSQIDPAFLRPIGRILGSVNRVLTSP